MTDFDSMGKLVSPSAMEKDDAGLPAERNQPVLISDDDVFIKKIFLSSPYTAFDLLFRKYYGVLCNHAVRFVYSKQKAEDIVSEVFVLFWKGKLYTSVTKSYRTYLFTAVRNRCLTHLKAELSKKVVSDIENEMLADRCTPEEILFASELHIKIEKTIRSLPPRQQQVFVMSRFEAKKNNIIAVELNLSMKTVEMHISKALAALRKIIPDKI
jgi:RNA polymerase sigma-70 factor (family 1)